MNTQDYVKVFILGSLLAWFIVRCLRLMKDWNNG